MTHNIDANQNVIVDALRAVGCTVKSLAAVGLGFPDLIVGYRGQNFLLEIKSEKGKLRPTQKEFFEWWQGQSDLVREIEEAFRVVGIDYE